MKQTLVFTAILAIFFAACTTRTNPNASTDSSDIIDTSKYYYIISVNSGKNLDVEGGSVENGVKLIQYSNNGYDNQRFKFKLHADGAYSIMCKKSGLFLDVFENSIEDGAPIVQWQYSGNDNQKFEVLVQKDGSVIFICKHSDKSFDIKSASLDDGATLIQWINSGGANQKFKLEIAL
ncbi:MAG TPA: hypothetical protein DEH02_18735 [Bacteroidales bacterium]|nr:MAG: hypothetical protein A2X01_06850 [Bacteroidetes bacterium GWF2_35_48]OFZ01989.1 MAG: hypothetical protein A2491_17970 [Bacteroidetes bacterium RIFOXYC12_FULL_35_7]HBX53104.1 hypothetical protein [Bacteroidales bacterium]